MRVIIADFSGFCFGVERAIGMVEKAASSGGSVVTLGPIIHNPQVVGDLEKAGVGVVNSVSEAPSNSTIVVRSHGVEKNVLAELSAGGRTVLDATCPFVRKAQGMVETLSRDCDAVVILGEAKHPEVRGLVSYAESECFVVANIEEAELLPVRKRYGFLAQTTQNNEIFEKISVILRGKCDSLRIVKTICNATNQRRKASVALAGEVDVMIVVGGKNSANTTRLYHLCGELCKATYHIETPEELSGEIFRGVETVGITAGASTPKSVVQRVREYILEVSR